MAARTGDWLRMVYGAGWETTPVPDEVDRPLRTEIVVRYSPSRLDPAGAPGRLQRVRVTVAPSESGLWWALYLRAPDPAALQRSARIWWKVEPGTWQPMISTSEVVATGRGRVRLDVDLRAAPDADRTGSPRLQFTALSRA